MAVNRFFDQYLCLRVKNPLPLVSQSSTVIDYLLMHLSVVYSNLSKQYNKISLALVLDFANKTYFLCV